jgi:hypothetical protein
MTWKADVPFPAEDTSHCRGCDALIGWIRKEDGGAHPVEVKGWEGVGCAEGFPGSHKGRTLDGDILAVREPDPDGAPSLFGDRATRDLCVVFESHFVHCPKRDRFYASARNKDRQS